VIAGALLGTGCSGGAGELFPGMARGVGGAAGGPAAARPEPVGGSAGPSEVLARAGGGGAPAGVAGADVGNGGAVGVAAGGGPGFPTAAAGGRGLGDAGLGAGRVDAGSPVAPPPLCDPCPCSDGLFGEPELVLGLGLGLQSFGPAPSADGLTLLFSAIGDTEDIFSARRTSRANQFSAATLVPGVNGDDTEEGTPFLTEDGRELYFFSTRPDPGTVGGRDLWVATASGGGFAAPSVVPRVNQDGLDHLPRLTPDGLALMFVSGRNAETLVSNIWVAERPDQQSPFGEPVELAGANSDGRDEGFWLSPDGLTLYLASNRGLAGDDDMDIFVAVRPDTTSPFEEAQNLAVVNTPGIEIDPALTADGFELFFASDRSGAMQLYRSARRCP